LFTLESLVAQIIDAVEKNNANPAIVERTHIQDMPTMSPNVNPVELERALEGTTVPSAKRHKCLCLPMDIQWFPNLNYLVFN
jgi:hypothetical protein